jgi:hypothetical protein
MFGGKVLVDVWWEVWREIVGRKCGGMFGGSVLVESLMGC